MAVGTNTATYAFTRTATHLAGAITASLAETLLSIGISAAEVQEIYTYEQAILAWINEKSLDKVLVEIVTPQGKVIPGYTWEIDYAVDPAQAFRDQLARLRRQVAKEPRVQPGSTFKVTAIHRPGWSLSEQPGWSPRTTPIPDLSGGYRHGTAASGPGASAVLRSHRMN